MSTIGSARAHDVQRGAVQGDRGKAGASGETDRGSGELLPPATVFVSSGSIASVVLMMDRSLARQRDGAEARRDASEASQELKEKQAVASMRSEADAILKGAVASGFLSIAGGALQLTGSLMNAKAVALEPAPRAGSEAAACPPPPLTTAEAAATSQAKRLAAQAGAVSAGGGLLSGASGSANGYFGAGAKQDQADQSERSNEAQAKGREAQRAARTADELGELRQKAIARLEQLLDSEQQGRLALIQRA